MSKPIRASINLTQLGEIARQGHTAIKRAGKANNVYVNLDIWLNDRQDNYGNDVSITLSSTKAGRDGGEKKVYVGNGKTGGSASTSQSSAGWGVPPAAPAPDQGNGAPEWGGGNSKGLSSDDLPF